MFKRKLKVCLNTGINRSIYGLVACLEQRVSGINYGFIIFIYLPIPQSLTKIPHEHVPKLHAYTCDHMWFWKMFENFNFLVPTHNRLLCCDNRFLHRNNRFLHCSNVLISALLYRINCTAWDQPITVKKYFTVYYYYIFLHKIEWFIDFSATNKIDNL